MLTAGVFLCFIVLIMILTSLESVRRNLCQEGEPDVVPLDQLTERLKQSNTALEAAVVAYGGVVPERRIPMSGELEALEAEVARNDQVDQSAITLLNGLAAKIEEMKNDPVRLQALADEMKASSDALAAAVQANTPQT